MKLTQRAVDLFGRRRAGASSISMRPCRVSACAFPPTGTKAGFSSTAIGGRQRRLTLGTLARCPLAAARAAAREAFDKVARGIDPSDERERAKAGALAPATFDAVADVFLESYCAKRLRPGNLYETRRIFAAYLKPAWRGRPLSNVTKGDVRTLLAAIVERGAGVQANRVLMRLKKFFNWCVDEEYLPASPVARMKPQTREVERSRVLSDDELRWFWQGCERLGFPFGPLFQLLLLTLQRRDEVGGMTWRELDLDVAMWTLPPHRVKNAQVHDVPLAAEARAVVVSVPELGLHVFPSTRGERPVSGFSKAKARLDRYMVEARRAELGFPLTRRSPKRSRRGSCTTCAAPARPAWRG